LFGFRGRGLFGLCLLFFSFLLCRLWLFLFFLFGGFLFWCFLALSADERDFVADTHLTAFLNVDFGERPVLR
jgi:hypothetical protein